MTALHWWQVATIAVVALIAGANIGLLLAGLLHAAAEASDQAERVTVAEMEHRLAVAEETAAEQQSRADFYFDLYRAEAARRQP